LKAGKLIDHRRTPSRLQLQVSLLFYGRDIHISHCSSAMSLAVVRLHLSQKEAEDLEHGFNYSLHMEVSPSVLISTGIEIEDQQ
jgi:hypothetical protein